MMCCSVREAQSRIHSDEFAEWCAYHDIDPWGEDRQDLRMGIICSVIANVHVEKGRRQFVPKDFIPEFEKAVQTKKSSKQMVSLLKAISNRVVKKKDK